MHSENNNDSRNDSNTQNNSSEYSFSPGFGFVRPDKDMAERISIKLTAIRVGFVMLTYILINMAGDFVYSFFVSNFLTGSQNANSQLFVDVIAFLLEIIIITFTLFFPFYLYMKRLRVARSVVMPLKRPSISVAVIGIFIMLGIMVLGSFVGDLLTRLISELGFTFYNQSFLYGGSAAYQIMGFVKIVILPAIVEEIVFRGILMQSLRRHGDGFALIVSAVFFAIFHTNPAQIPYAFISGIIIGYFVLRTGSVTTGIVIHFTSNAMAFFLSVFSGHLEGEAAVIFSYASFAVLILSGIVAFVIFVRRHQGLFRLSDGKSTIPTGNKLKIFFKSPVIVLPLILFVIQISLSLRL